MTADREPLVEAEVTLRGLPWMRLDTSRLMDSDLFALSTGDEFKAAVALWCKAWTQQPAGSLPTDDRLLAHLSGAGARWKKVKTMALRGWVLCDDGRLYHAVVAEQVLAAWEERQEYREKIDGQNVRQRNLREERATLMADLKAAGIRLAWNTPISEIRARHAVLSRTVTVTGDDQSRTCHGDRHGIDGTGRDGNIKAVLHTSSRADRTTGLAAEMARAIHGYGFPDCSESHPDLLALADAGFTVADVVGAAKVASERGKGLGWLSARLHGQRLDAAARGSSATGVATPAPVDARVVARRAAKYQLDLHVATIVSDCDSLQLITPEQRDQRVKSAEAAFEAEWGPLREAQA